MPNVPGLYRNTRTGMYYGCKKVDGRRKERSLATADRKIAERRLKEWIANLGKVDSAVEKTTLKQLCVRFIAVSQGKADSTLCIIKAIVKEFENWWPYGPNPEVRNIRPSHVEEWLALHERRLKNTSYNRYAGILKQLFELAVNDRIIAESPFDRVRTRWKKPQTPVRRVPTLEQFQAIVDEVRSEKRSSHARESADFLEFLGLAGVGQAEASSLTWGDVDFTRNSMSFRRHKTDTRFPVPIYPHLRPLLERLRQEAGPKIEPAQLVLKIKDGKKALANACARLGLPHFSQRNLRQCLIMRLWKSGIDKKLIAKWQGHQDGGQLILDTYTEIFGADDAAYEMQQLAKLEVAPSPDPAAKN
ncbi:tyrosine-type recombinase/integrase [Luteolibacter sp.]|uniref:tyrosine-type recombinase/integrase n=2 Tax=Luteolibacter sp. TaxID=1962973 RepID=UPI003266742B